MANTINRQELLEKLGKLGIVKTQSGPVVSAKQQMVDMMTKGTPKPVGDQTSQKWDRRKYDNSPLNMNRNYLNLKDLGIRIMTESRQRALNEAGELNFNIDLPVFTQTAISGKMVCLGHEIKCQILGPNDMGKLSIILDDETTGKSTQKNLSPDADEFKGNLANVIKRIAVDLVKSGDTAESLDELTQGVGAVTGFAGNDNFGTFNDLDIAEMAPSTLVRNESVDWQLESLRKLCNKAVMEADDFSADDFAAPAEDGGAAPDAGMDPAAAPAPQNAGEVNGNADGTAKDAPDTMEFTRFCIPQVGDEHYGLDQKAVDTMNKLIASAYAKDLENDSSGVKPGEDEILNGWSGTMGQTRDIAVPLFLKFYPALGDKPLPKDGLVKMAKALDEGIDYKTFNERLSTWFPEVYNEDGTSINDVDAQAAAMRLPGDDPTGTGVGFSPNAPIGEPNGGAGGTADMMAMADDIFGEPGTEAKEGEGDTGLDNVDFDLAALDKI